ncbi:radical SAM protein [Filimonas effusa]|uniref:SPASM domain-containing protein n=1 Tax=Filimonas effusa TaxID=2508721 RepID=A0A4Q1DBA5_9BACT|nr:radical SAM protein [Filimonas effusa]RXK85853.1 SPASM domain-containing protein [Filimonas effusa]
MKYKCSNYITASDIINEDAGQEDKKRLILSTRSGKNIVIKEAAYQDLVHSRLENFDESTMAYFIASSMVVPENEKEFQFVIQENEANNINTLGMVIHTSANCQLGCSYCGQQHSKKNIPQDVKQRIFTYITNKLKTGKFKFVFVTWHGGEPLMSLSDLRLMSKEIIKICQEFNVAYLSKMITNGLSLKPSIFNELFHELKIIDFQITIDGPKEFHDNRRFTKEGQLGTFDIILKNILGICASPTYPVYERPIGIRINIDKTNGSYIPGFIDLLAENKLHDKIQINFRPVENYVNNKFKDSNGFSKEEYAQVEIDLLLHTLKAGFSVDSVLPERKYDACMAVLKDHIALDIFGNVFPCYNFAYTKHLLEQENKIGNLLFDEETFNNDVPLRKWYSTLETEREECFRCNMLPVCGGYCPLKWMEGEIACPSYRYNISERLVLNYLFNKTDIKELLNQH